MAMKPKDSPQAKKALRVLHESVGRRSERPTKPVNVASDRNEDAETAARVLRRAGEPQGTAADPHLVLTPTSADAGKAAHVLHETVGTAATSGGTSEPNNGAGKTPPPDAPYAFAFPPGGSTVLPFSAPSHGLAVMTGVAAVLSRGFVEISREGFVLGQKRFEKNLQSLTAVAQCRSIPELLAVQTKLLTEKAQELAENSRRIAELSTRVASEVAEKIAAK